MANIGASDSPNNNEIVDTFWTLTDRKKKPEINPNRLEPEEFHHWGKVRNIKKMSPTLTQLVDTKGLDRVINKNKTFCTILSELEVEYRIEDLKTFKPSDKAVVFDVESVPGWAFYGLAPTRQQAIENAASRGLEFLYHMNT